MQVDNFTNGSLVCNDQPGEVLYGAPPPFGQTDAIENITFAAPLAAGCALIA